MTDTVRYDSRTVLLHWLTAGLIALNWGLAQIIDEFGKPYAVWPRSFHILLGVALMLIVLGRLAWRNTGGRRLPPADEGWKHIAARAAHWVMYGLLIAIIGFGIATEMTRGDDILTLGRLPQLLPVDRDLRRAIHGYHELTTNMLLVVAGIHAAAALAHHYLWKDGVLRRMTVG